MCHFCKIIVCGLGRLVNTPPRLEFSLFPLKVTNIFVPNRWKVERLQKCQLLRSAYASSFPKSPPRALITPQTKRERHDDCASCLSLSFISLFFLVLLSSSFVSVLACLGNVNKKKGGCDCKSVTHSEEKKKRKRITDKEETVGCTAKRQDPCRQNNWCVGRRLRTIFYIHIHLVVADFAGCCSLQIALDQASFARFVLSIPDKASETRISQGRT